MLHIVLVRHGDVPGIRPARFRGRAPLQLTALGQRQAQVTANRIARQWRPSIVYSSPLDRCMATAAAISAATGAAVVALDGFNDLDYGAWQGQTCEQVRATYPQQFQRWLTAPDLYRFPQGESLAGLALRVTDALRFILEQHADATVVIVGHDSSNRVLLLQALGLPLAAYRRIAQAPCGVSEISFSDRGAQVGRMNETAHLAAMDTTAPLPPVS
jgi:probable phosphoglycerate mutase